MKITYPLCVATLLVAGIAHANTVEILDLHTQTQLGTVTLSQSQYGVVFTPHLSGLSAGLHGFHVHTSASCGNSIVDGKKILGGAAGGHYDPELANRHGAPWESNAHKGDLPPLYVDMKGDAVQPVLAPRLTLEELKGRALMIHEGGDNHSDHPIPLGGGGMRLACGVIGD